MVQGAVASTRWGLACQVFPDKRSLLTCSPSSQAAIDYSHSLFTMATAPSSNRLQDDAVESKHPPDRCRTCLWCDALYFQGQLGKVG
jgi:hypothetical protein